MLLLLNPAYDAAAHYREARRWADRYAAPLRDQIRPHDNDRSTNRRIRIGYVSPDLRHHAVGWNLVPLLAHHDHERFEVFCYSASTQVDEITLELRQHADAWRKIHNLSDAAAADMIRRDRIDILIDLSLHTADHRLLVFARKPAPVAVTYLGYCGTTGLDTIDYRLSDPYMDPPETDLSVYSERTARLPTSYWCYRPAGPAPDINELPSLKNGYVTFGCLNQFTKISPAAFQAWARIMVAVPRSRLIIHYEGAKPLQSVIAVFATNGVSPDRLEFVPKLPWLQYLQAHQRIDVALDPFPYAGGITTCDSLWMGVPVVSLSGQTAVGRGGRSILNNIGLRELVAFDPTQYVQIAVSLANDPQRLRELRAGLRQRMQSSPLMDPKRFAKEVEAAYATMWKRWAQGDAG